MGVIQEIIVIILLTCFARLMIKEPRELVAHADR